MARRRADDDVQWDRARQAVRDELFEQQPDLEREQDIPAALKLDLTTARKFFNGEVERPRLSTRNKIEDALHWRRGKLEAIARGLEDRVPTPQQIAGIPRGISQRERDRLAAEVLAGRVTDEQVREWLAEIDGTNENGV